MNMTKSKASVYTFKARQAFPSHPVVVAHWHYTSVVKPREGPPLGQ